MERGGRHFCKLCVLPLAPPSFSHIFLLSLSSYQT